MFEKFVEEMKKRDVEYIHNDYAKKEQKYKEEIERLNNIINELETYIIENSFGSPLHNCSVIETYKILDKLQELKENKND